MFKWYAIPPFLLQSTLWWLIAWPIVKIFSRFEVAGMEHLRSLSGPVIFAPNHSNEIDATLLPLALPLWSRFSPLFYVAREKQFYQDPAFSWRRYFYGGLGFLLLGAHPILAGKKNYALALKNHLQILKDGASVCIFPEGTFTKTGELGAPHGGVGYLAFASARPVVPVYISGTFNLTLFDMLRFRRVRVEFCAPLYPKDFFHSDAPTIEEYHAAADAIFAKIQEAKQRHAQ